MVLMTIKIDFYEHIQNPLMSFGVVSEQIIIYSEKFLFHLIFKITDKGTMIGSAQIWPFLIILLNLNYCIFFCFCFLLVCILTFVYFLHNLLPYVAFSIVFLSLLLKIILFWNASVTKIVGHHCDVLQLPKYQTN